MPSQTEALFDVLANPERIALLTRLLRGEATEIELRLELSLDQTVASRALREMRLVGLLLRDRPKGPNRVAYPDHTRTLLKAANALALKILSERQREDEDLGDELA